MRLPKSALPKSYDVELWVNLATCEFHGTLHIDLDIVESTSSITLNSAELNIAQESIFVRSPGAEIIRPTTCNIDQDNELLLLQFAAPLPVGQFTLCLNYEGVLNEKLDGFYRSTYHIGGVPKNMAVTDFEPANARRFFPCWDEPIFKASFKFKVHAPSDRTVLSTMPLVREYFCDESDSKVAEFAKSSPMSTYVVALVIGEFEYMEVLTEDGIPVRVYTLPGELDKGKFGLDLAVKLLPFYAKYFQLRYPLPKLDIVAVPVFKAGGLEEFGLIVFRDIALFVDSSSSASQRQQVAINMAHEVAHMWFGNIVTLEWWTHIWLNEGMATWISYMAVDYLFPEWNIWMEFHDEIMHGLRMDSFESTHPVEVEIIHARNTMEVFDAISYCKGASLVHMLQHYLGPTDLQRGLILYMEKFAFANANSDDLWSCFHEVSGKTIKEIMSSWTKQKGYPLVTATLLSDHELHMEQSLFHVDGLSKEGQWAIPISISSGAAHDSLLLLTDRSCVVPISSQTVKINFGQTGFYRVHYDGRLIAGLKDSIISGSLFPLDRLGLLDDMFALCQIRKERLSTIISFLEAYSIECDPTVLSKLIDVALSISSVMVVALPGLLEEINHFLSKLLETATWRLGWEAVEDESHLNSSIREKLLYALVMLDNKDTILEAQKRFKASSGFALASNIRKATYMSMMKVATSSNRSGYESLLEIYKLSHNIEERNQVLEVIGASLDLELLIEALDFSLSSEVLAQDVSRIFKGVLINNGSACWKWLKDNWSAVYYKLGDGFLLRRVLELVTSKLWSKDMVNDVQEFISSGTSSFKHLGDKCGEAVKLMAMWIDGIKCDKDLLEHFQES